MNLNQITEADDLALSVTARLEAGESLGSVALSARRLAEVVGDLTRVMWLRAEIGGFDGVTPIRKWTPEENDGLRMFFRLRSVALIENWEQYIASVAQPLRARDKMLTAPLATLETLSHPSLDVHTAEGADLLAQALSTYAESQRIQILIRQEMHSWATQVRQHVKRLRSRTEAFGVDAITVFAAGGNLLTELGHALDSLGRPGMAATAAIQARTALLVLGRELYKGGPRHTSPLTGETHQVNGEKNQLRAVLDELWVSAPAERRALLERAGVAVEEAYELGSKAKNPVALTHEEATRAVHGVYTVAHAICFTGGFPPQQTELAGTAPVT